LSVKKAIMNNKIFLFSIAVIGLGLGAQAFAESLSTKDGTTYDNITKKRIDADGLYIEYQPQSGGMGVAKVKFARLSRDQQKHFGYDAERASNYEEQYAAGMAVWRAEQDSRDKAVHQARDAAYANEIASAQVQARKNEQMLAADQQQSYSLQPTGNGYVTGFGVSLVANVLPHIAHPQPATFQHIPITQPFIGTAASAQHHP
jgi:hypothetical protein